MKTLAERRPETEGQVLRAAAIMLLVLSLPVVALGLATASGLIRLPYELSLLDHRLPILFRAHMMSAGLALLLVSAAIAYQGSSLHKVVGRSAAVVVLIGGITALPVALASDASWPARAGFVTQGLVWIGLVLAGVQAIRAGQRLRHQRLMLAVAAVASAALWLRLASWVATHWGLPFETTYALAAWLSWILPLAAVGLVTRNRGARPPRALPEALNHDPRLA